MDRIAQCRPETIQRRDSWQIRIRESAVAQVVHTIIYGEVWLNLPCVTSVKLKAIVGLSAVGIAECGTLGEKSLSIADVIEATG